MHGDPTDVGFDEVGRNIRLHPRILRRVFFPQMHHIVNIIPQAVIRLNMHLKPVPFLIKSLSINVANKAVIDHIFVDQLFHVSLLGESTDDYTEEGVEDYDDYD